MHDKGDDNYLRIEIVAIMETIVLIRYIPTGPW